MGHDDHTEPGDDCGRHRIVVHKGYFKFEDFYSAYQLANVDAHDALVHFRITTRGDGTADNCHPFALANGALVHNGTIVEMGERGKGKSDTRELAEHLHDLDFAALKKLKPMLEAFLGYNKVAVLDASGEVLVFNENSWIEHEGVLYSNSDFREHSSFTFGTGVGTGIGTYQGTGPGYTGLVDDSYEWDTGSYARGKEPVVDDEDEMELAMEDYPNLWFDQRGLGHWCCERLFKDTWAEAGFFWNGANFDLYILGADGLPQRANRLEDEVFYVWQNLLGNQYLPDEDDAQDMHLLENITYDLLQEQMKCKSTPSVTALPTATPTASSPLTSMATSPSPSSSTTKSPVSAAT